MFSVCPSRPTSPLLTSLCASGGYPPQTTSLGSLVTGVHLGHPVKWPAGNQREGREKSWGIYPPGSCSAGLLWQWLQSSPERPQLLSRGSWKLNLLLFPRDSPFLHLPRTKEWSWLSVVTLGCFAESCWFPWPLPSSLLVVPLFPPLPFQGSQPLSCQNLTGTSSHITYHNVLTILNRQDQDPSLPDLEV